MGCHLYIHQIDNDREIEIPFLSIRSLDGYRILTKAWLEHLLWAEHIYACSAIYQNHISIKELKKSPENWERIAIYRHWYYPNSSTRNVGFERLREELQNDAVATIEMLNWDITRIKNYMWTEERISEVLEKFQEGIHYAETI